MSERRKRYLLYALYRAEGNALSIDRLAIRMVELEGEEFAGAERSEHVVDEFRRQHVPELEAAGFIEYDDRSETVRYRRIPSFEEWLEHAEYKEGKHPDG
ncbi:MAG: hypothetical protein QXG03_07655 [Halalkalicoccus sp.]